MNDIYIATGQKQLVRTDPPRPLSLQLRSYKNVLKKQCKMIALGHCEGQPAL